MRWSAVFLTTQLALFSDIVNVSRPVCFPGAKAPQWNYLRGESVNQENSGNIKSQSHV